MIKGDIRRAFTYLESGSVLIVTTNDGTSDNVMTISWQMVMDFSPHKGPFLVKVSISDLNIRTGPGTDYSRVQFCPPGIYTIVEVKRGKGSAAGWGRLKSGVGWISLDFVKRV